mgnify:CR=1 FL=1
MATIAQLVVDVSANTAQIKTAVEDIEVAHGWATVRGTPACGKCPKNSRNALPGLFDANGAAQPMPRPLLKSGHNALQRADLVS